MATQIFKFKLVTALPTLAAADLYTLYLVKETSKSFARLVKVNTGRTAWVSVTDSDMVGSDLFSFGTTQPAAGSSALLWFHPTTKEMRLRTAANTWTLFENISQGAVWSAGSATPSNSTGNPGDMYLKSDGTIWSRGASAWTNTNIKMFVESPLKKTIRVIEASGIAALANSNGGADELLLVVDHGLYIHKNGSTDHADSVNVLTSKNGRWLIECYGSVPLAPFVSQVVSTAIGAAQGSNPAMTLALSSIANEAIERRIVTERFLISPVTIATNATVKLTLNAQDLELGDFISVAPLQPLVEGINISAYVSNVNEFQVVITNKTALPFDLVAYWNYLIIKPVE